jgi:hypothetical protein
LAVARVELAARGELVIELAPVDLPAGGGHHAAHHALQQPPVSVAEMPTSGAGYGFRIEAWDADGREVPPEVVHHFNVIDPERRELFLPISRRVLAAGAETGTVRLPWLLVGAPFARGQRLVASAMLHNPTGVAYRGVRVRLVMSYVPDGRPWPLFTTYPWQLDVAFPVGDKSFDLPPGRSERSYEGSPAVAGTIVAVGGHLHDHGVRIDLRDATTGELIWEGIPIKDKHGRVTGVPIGRLYGLTSLGYRIVPQHRYRVTVVYDNPTGEVLPGGGMGVVAGLFVPDRGAAWPTADFAESLYQQDLRHALRLATGAAAPLLPGSLEHTHH